MLRRRDPVAIESVGRYLNTCGKDLASLKSRLNQLIDHIHDDYVGADADSIVTNFKNETNKIDTFLESNDYFQSYMGEVSAYDTETVDTFQKDMQDVIDYFDSNKVNDPNADSFSADLSNSKEYNITTYLSESDSTAFAIDPSGKKGTAFLVDTSGKNPKNVTTSVSTTGTLVTSTANKAKSIATRLSDTSQDFYAVDSSGKNHHNNTTVLSTTGSLRAATGNKIKNVTSRLSANNSVGYAIDKSGKYKQAVSVDLSGKNPKNITTSLSTTGSLKTATGNKTHGINTYLSETDSIITTKGDDFYE